MDPKEFDEDNENFEEHLKNIERSLQQLGFTVNDSKIYITLLKIGLNSPAKISEKSQVDRARVYDSLKRLLKRGVVEEEPVPRAPRYRAVPPEIVFSKIRKQFENKIKLSKEIEEQLRNLHSLSKEQNSVWAIQGDQKIKKTMYQFLDAFNNFAYLILTHEYGNSIKEFSELADLLYEKKRQNPDLVIKVALVIDTEDHDQKIIINHLYHANIEIFRWVPGSIPPFGLVLTEDGFMQTFLNTINPKPRYGFGIFMENCAGDQLLGFKHLCEWVFSNLCKRVIFKKKTKKNKEGEENQDSKNEQEKPKGEHEESSHESSPSNTSTST